MQTTGWVAGSAASGTQQREHSTVLLTSLSHEARVDSRESRVVGAVCDVVNLVAMLKLPCFHAASPCLLLQSGEGAKCHDACEVWQLSQSAWCWPGESWGEPGHERESLPVGACQMRARFLGSLFCPGSHSHLALRNQQTVLIMTPGHQRTLTAHPTPQFCPLAPTQLAPTHPHTVAPLL